MENAVKKETPEQKKSRLVTQLGGVLHDEWRAQRKKEDGTYESRAKKTKDQEWVKSHGSDEVDIANTDYADLPEDWRGENKISAEIAVEEICKALENRQELDDAFTEEASGVIHEKWLERNKEWATDEQNKQYGELSEEEKNKDRAIIKKAIEVFQNAV